MSKKYLIKTKQRIKGNDKQEQQKKTVSVTVTFNLTLIKSKTTTYRTSKPTN